MSEETEMRRTPRRQALAAQPVEDTPLPPAEPVESDAVDSGDDEEPWVNPAILAARRGEQVEFGAEIAAEPAAEPEADTTD